MDEKFKITRKQYLSDSRKNEILACNLENEKFIIIKYFTFDTDDKKWKCFL